MARKGSKRVKPKRAPLLSAASWASKTQAGSAPLGLNSPSVAPGSRGARPLRFLLTALGLMATLYSLFFFPYSGDSGMAKTLANYLGVTARLVGFILKPWDSSVSVEGAVIHGRFPLEIVTSCSGLDTQALFAGAVLAFPSSWRKKLLGLMLGILALGLANAMRIVGLYWVGVARPDLFDLVHEELFAFLTVTLAALAFLAWASWAHKTTAKGPA